MIKPYAHTVQVIDCLQQRGRTMIYYLNLIRPKMSLKFVNCST